MQLTGLVALGLLALKVTAISPEAGNDVEARDFSGESLNEFDIRTPEEEELDARTDYGYNKCGSGAYWKHGSCRCHKHWEKYDKVAKKCYKPLKCTGDNVKVEGYGYGNEKCVCTIDGQTYDDKLGCQCAEGYSLKKDKCVKDCEYGQKYSDEYGCYTPCVGKHVKEEWSGHPPTLTCVCKKHGFEYDASKGGCYYPCPENSHYDKESHSCKCDTYGYIVKDNVCVAPCVGDDYFYKHGKCYCKSRDEYYDEHEGCKPRCPEDQKYDHYSRKCVCKDHEKVLKDNVCVLPCVGDDYYYKKGQCFCKKWDEVYDEHEGCKPRCDGDAKYNKYTHKCECKHGEEYVEGKGCQKTCKHPATLEYGECKCPGDQKYSWKKGCYCPWGQKYSSEHAKCYTPCSKPNQVIEWKYGYAKCVCKKGYKPGKYGCVKKNDHYGGYY